MNVGGSFNDLAVWDAFLASDKNAPQAGPLNEADSDTAGPLKCARFRVDTIREVPTWNQM